MNQPYGPDIDPVILLPVVRSTNRITSEDVRRADDDDLVRHLEISGYSPEEIE